MFRRKPVAYLSLRMVAALLLLLPLILAVPPAGAQSGWEVVASGLNNPRGLALGPEGALYVAEAGLGGPDCFEPEPGFTLCTGFTGSITRIWKGAQSRIVENLASASDNPFGFAIHAGPTDISLLGRGGAYVVVGLGADPAHRQEMPNGAYFGQLVHIPASGKWRNIADVSAYETAANPDGGLVDSNPYGLLALPSGRIVADAGGNDLLQVKANGQIQTLAVFPDEMAEFPPGSGNYIPMQAVPTSVALGPDGAYYVGLLTGFPFPAGGAKVFRVAPNGDMSVFAEGFTMIIDVQFGRDGSLYVLELVENIFGCDPFGNPASCVGTLNRIYPDGAREVIANDLVLPGGVAISDSGEIFVSINSIYPGAEIFPGSPTGAVVRLNAGAVSSNPPSVARVNPADSTAAGRNLFGIDTNHLWSLALDNSIFLPGAQR